MCLTYVFKLCFWCGEILKEGQTNKKKRTNEKINFQDIFFPIDFLQPVS